MSEKECYEYSEFQTSVPQWIMKAQRRLQYLKPLERLDEEILCLESWLTLNPYEVKARTLVFDDISSSLISTSFSYRIVPVGSCVYHL